MIETISWNDNKFPFKLLTSLQETGFAVIIDHPISKEAISNAYEYWKEFFSTSLEFKKGLIYDPKENNQGGYFPFKSENAKGQSVSDLKEFYHYYVGGKLPVNPINVLGVYEPVSPDVGPHSVTELFRQMEAVGIKLLEDINLCLPNEIWKNLSMDLEVMADNSPSTLLRALHYPPIQDRDSAAGAVRAAAHEDINLITLLPAATASGLEVMNKDGSWYKVQDEPNALIVNVGDMLQLATSGYLKSTTHQVVNTVDGMENSRYSMPMFVHPWPKTKLSETKTAEQYLSERLAEIGLKK